MVPLVVIGPLGVLDVVVIAAAGIVLAAIGPELVAIVRGWWPRAASMPFSGRRLGRRRRHRGRTGMTNRVELYDSTYGHFADAVLAAVRAETFGRDIGQNSWLTVDEFDRFISWLELAPGSHVLEVASGSGGPALHLAATNGCRVSGVDANESGIDTATRAAAAAGQAGRVDFRLADANAPLPFADASFDGLACIDAVNHFADRPGVLRDWHRLLRPGRRAVFTDPVVITGPVTGEELARRGNIGFFLFTPPGVNERLIAEAGFRLVKQEDVTANVAAVSGRWLDARERRRDALLPIEGEERYAGLQTFFTAVHRLSSEGRLSRFAYGIEKPGARG